MYLWSGTLSVFSAKVRIAVAEKGLPVEIREVPWTRAAGWGEKPAELLAVSPRAQLPALVDGDFAVFDSTVINEYLDDRYPQVPLRSADPASRARCRMWEELGDDVLNGIMPVLVREVFMKPDGAGRDDAAVDDARTRLNAHHQRLEQALQDGDFLCGHYSVADIGNFLAVAFCGILGAPPAEELTHLAAWFERVRQRPPVLAEFDAILSAAGAA